MTIRFAERMSRLGTESAFEVLARARQIEATGRDVIHLEIGEPDFATPDNVVEAAVSALHDGATHYTPAGGIPEVRQALAGFVSGRTGVEVAPEEVVLVPGSKNIVHFTLLSCVEPGDEVLYPDPGYPAYESLARFVGARPVPVPLLEEHDFRLDLDRLEEIARLAGRHDLIVLSDEIYSQIVYDAEHVSMLSIPGMKERTVLLDGMSKAYAMCGWRLGYGVAPVELAQRFERLMINTSSCAAAFTQLAAVEAWESPESGRAVTRMVEAFRRRRDLVVERLNRLPGVRCRVPQGAFYAFPNIEGTGFDERALAAGLLEEAGVAVLAGTAFGAGGKGFIRLAYTQAESDLERGLERMGAYLETHRPAAV
jgi:aspartate aminotransferase